MSRGTELSGTNASMPAVYAGGVCFRPLAKEKHAPLFRVEGNADGGEALIRFSVLNDNYTYLLLRDREATAVDPGDAEPLIGFIRENGLSLTRILVTHHHADHSGGCQALKRATGCTVLGPRDPRIPGLDRPLEEGGVMNGGALDFTAVHVPGHTRSHLAYAFRVEGAVFLFSGDCLFPAGCGRVVEGTHREMLTSLRKLAAPEDEASHDAVLLAGHEYTLENLAFALSLEPGNEKVKNRADRFRSRLGKWGVSPASLVSEERETNPFLRSADPLLKKALGMEGAGDLEVFTETRGRKDRFLFP